MRADPIFFSGVRSPDEQVRVHSYAFIEGESLAIHEIYYPKWCLNIDDAYVRGGNQFAPLPVPPFANSHRVAWIFPNDANVKIIAENLAIRNN